MHVCRICVQLRSLPVGCIQGRKYVGHVFFSDFNQPLENWKVSKVKNMACLFLRNKKFNQKLCKWDVSKVFNMEKMFMGSVFNQDISNWQVSGVFSMAEMFKESQFNQDLSRWDVSGVGLMNGMFENSMFEGDLSRWDVSGLPTPEKMLSVERMFLGSKKSVRMGKMNPSLEEVLGLDRERYFERALEGASSMKPKTRL